jgi:hypothetical protein
MRPADITAFRSNSGELLLRLPIARRTRRAVDLADNRGSPAVASTAETDFGSQRNGTSFATMHVAAGAATTTTFIAVSETVLEPDDVPSITVP